MSADVAVGKMPPDIKKAWLEALRSGEFEQTQGTLKDDMGYCCLGVLCHVLNTQFPEVVKRMGVTIEEWDEAINISNGEPMDDQSTMLHPDMREVLGLTEVGNLPLPRGGSLAMENDDLATFEEIANLIEEQL